MHLVLHLPTFLAVLQKDDYEDDYIGDEIGRVTIGWRGTIFGATAWTSGSLRKPVIRLWHYSMSRVESEECQNVSNRTAPDKKKA